MFHPHPSRVLNDHFARKPHQGADPHAARFLFIGLDANYASDIEQSPIFPSLLEYHEDGPRFWRKKRVHHPFLLPGHNGDGRRYHLKFAKIGFQPQHADLVAFIALLHLPTAGRSALTPQDLESSHLEGVRRAVFQGAARFIFLSASVQRLMGATAMQFVFRSPKFPLLFDAGSSLLFARSKAQLATTVAKLSLPSGERREIIDATGEGFCMYPEKMIVAPSVAMRKWTKMKIIDLYNSRRPSGAPEMRSTSLGNRSLSQVVSEAVELLAQQQSR